MELSDREQKVLLNLESLIRRGFSESGAADNLRSIIDDDALVERVIKFRCDVARQRRTIATSHAIFDPEEEGEPWYTGEDPSDIYWPALRDYLESSPKWNESVPSLDQSSTDIVGLLASPHSHVIRTRGLVLGFVQSGKTANFTATIAKAADAGYRLFIVLSGVHNSLRRQTQQRIDEQLVERHPSRWVQLTDVHRDFGRPIKALPLLGTPDLRCIAVVKKNVTRMTHLRDWLRQAQKDGALDNCPVLIIDDEADQASPNAARNPELDRTRINQRLTELLSLPRVAYVGYTATPFANVLVNPADTEDIYPRSFVYALPKPPSYFGSRELFGAPVSEDESITSNQPHDMIRIISDDEAQKHTTRALIEHGPSVTTSLMEAIQWFVLATTARRVRSGVQEHSSMLIHTTMRVDPQLAYLEPIRSFVKTMRKAVAGGDLESLRSLWQRETATEPASRHNLSALSFDDIRTGLPTTIDDLNVLADNGSSTDRLVYSEEPATVIAVGGNTLSRGLTLEGLVSSYFLRSSNAYDTLLQMGRWFGYRPGYSDLPRIWTTRQLANDFEFLSDVEDSLRSEIARYRTMDGATPENLPVRIVLHPRMQATARLKMHFAVRGDASFSAQRPQTTYFAHRDKALASRNMTAGRALLNTAKAQGVIEQVESSRVVLKDVSVSLIRKFIHDYSFHPDSEITSQMLDKYISGQVRYGALGKWNIAVIGVSEPLRRIDLGLNEASPLITRSKLARSSDSARASIGTLMSRPDRVADLQAAATVTSTTSDEELQDARDREGRGLLILYPIDRGSQPKPSAHKRIGMDAVDDLLGVAFCFPTAEPDSEAIDTIQVTMQRPKVSEQGQLDYVDIEGSQDEVSLDHV